MSEHDRDRIPTAHPLEFDHRGFPVPQSNREEFTERVRRLLAVYPRYDTPDRRTAKQ